MARRGDRIGGAVAPLHRQKLVQRLFKPAAEQMQMTLVGNAAAGHLGQFLRQVIAVDRAQKERGPDTLVEVLAGAAESVERGGRLQQLGGVRALQKPSNERLRTAGSRVVIMVTRSSDMRAARDEG